MDTEKKVTEMFDSISPTYDLVNTILSFGLDKRWRKKMISKIPNQKNLSLLDIATGTGEVLMEAFEKNKATMGVGVDLSTKMLEIAKQKFRRSPFNAQVNLLDANALSLPFEDAFFDATTMSYGIRNVQDVPAALKEMHRVLKDGGRSLILEFSLPKNKLLKKLHLLYLRKCLPKIGHYFSKSKSSYEYLNQTIESFPYGDDFLELLKEAGFSDCKAYPILGGITTLYTGEKWTQSA